MAERDIKSYLFGAWYSWMSDSGLTPHILVLANEDGVCVPSAYVKEDNTIVLNVSNEAIRSFSFDDQKIEFTASFSEGSLDIIVPFRALLGIFASENNKGTLFLEENEGVKTPASEDDKPSLKLV